MAVGLTSYPVNPMRLRFSTRKYTSYIVSIDRFVKYDLHWVPVIRKDFVSEGR